MVHYRAKVKRNTFHFKLMWLLLENFGLLFKLASGHSGRVFDNKQSSRVEVKKM